MKEIFISYSRQDQEPVGRLRDHLEGLDYGVFLDQDDIRAGRLWRAQIVQAIEDCSLYLIVLSENSLHSDNVRRELDLARQKNKSILPVFLVEQLALTRDMEYQLVGLQRLPFEVMFEDRVQGLLEELMCEPVTAFMSLDQEITTSALVHESGTRLPLLEDRLVIGRGAEAQINLSRWDRNRFVSKQHAQLLNDKGHWSIQVCEQSKNPTLVNGALVAPGEGRVLADGDELVFADIRFRFICAGDAER